MKNDDLKRDVEAAHAMIDVFHIPRKERNRRLRLPMRLALLLQNLKTEQEAERTRYQLGFPN